MATSALTSLPTELLDEIILHSLPEGFEGLALTCRKLYHLCIPSIEHHNQLRKRFRKFTCTKYTNDGLLSLNNLPAVNLIREIAHNPVVARYIRHADFAYDTWPLGSRPVRLLPDPDLGNPVAALFAESPYLREAGLDWREYYAVIQEELGSPGRYSQHAAAFLLTLLPNVTSLKVPCLWRRCEMADKLIHATVRRAVNRPSPSSLLWDRPSLAQVAELDLYDQTGRFPLEDKSELVSAVELLYLPKLRRRSSTGGGQATQDWDVCRLVTAIEREAGSCLESLEIVIHVRGSLDPGRLSMRGFQRLRKLHHPLEIAECNLTTGASARHKRLTDHELGELQRLTDILVPASVSDLSLHSRDPDRHVKALRVMFYDFAARLRSAVAD